MPVETHRNLMNRSCLPMGWYFLRLKDTASLTMIMSCETWLAHLDFLTRGALKSSAKIIGRRQECGFVVLQHTHLLARHKKTPHKCGVFKTNHWLRGQDLNLRPLGYEPNELPGCSTARYGFIIAYFAATWSLISSETSGRSTNSTKAIGALSPTRKPIFKIRV